MNGLQLLDTPILGNTPREWLVALAVSSIIMFAYSLIRPLLLRRLGAAAARTETRLDDALLQALQATRSLLVFVVALYVGAQYLDLPARPQKLLGAGATIAAFLQLGIWASALLKFWFERSRTRALATNAGAATSLSALSLVAQTVLWALVLLLALDNLGVNVTTLVAGLGVGGIAVALAVQNILGDLFASMSIVVDKPFVIGDFIIVDSYMGTVEYVGLKTTRIRSLGGEQIVFSNGDLLNARLRNYKRMYERRVLFGFGVLYQTTAEQLERIPAIVRGLIEQVGADKVRFDRAHFHKFGESSYDFEVVYWVLSPDYNQFMDIQQGINLGMVRAFAREQVEFAYPTRTIYAAAPLRVEAAMLAPARSDGPDALHEDAPSRLRRPS